jgi:hypothetical protein
MFGGYTSKGRGCLYANLLGAWFGVFPFNFKDLCGTIKARDPDYSMFCESGVFSMSGEAPAQVLERFRGAAAEHNTKVDSIR